MAYSNRTYDNTIAKLVAWSTPAPDPSGASYPGPGVFGVDTTGFTSTLVPEAGGGGSASFVWAPGGTPGPGVFTTWASLHAAVSAAPPQLRTVYLDTAVFAAELDPGTWDLSEWHFVGPSPTFGNLVIPDGAYFFLGGTPWVLRMTGVYCEYQGTTAPAVLNNSSMRIELVDSEIDCIGGQPFVENTGFSFLAVSQINSGTWAPDTDLGVFRAAAPFGNISIQAFDASWDSEGSYGGTGGTITLSLNSTSVGDMVGVGGGTYPPFSGTLTLQKNNTVAAIADAGAPPLRWVIDNANTPPTPGFVTNYDGYALTDPVWAGVVVRGGYLKLPTDLATTGINCTLHRTVLGGTDPCSIPIYRVDGGGICHFWAYFSFGAFPADGAFKSFSFSLVEALSEGDQLFIGGPSIGTNIDTVTVELFF